MCLPLVGCGQETNYPRVNNLVKKPINRSFEDVTLGMSEGEFKAKLIYQQRQLGRPYLVYSRAYNKLHGNRMKEIENVYEVWCDFFNGKLYYIQIVYNSGYRLSWDVFIHNTKQKYDNGKESPIEKEISWDDKKTTLTIKEEFGQQFGEPVSYYTVSYMDVKLGVEYLKTDQQSSPKF